MTSVKDNHKSLQEGSIDFVSILKNIWSAKVLVCKFIISFFFIGCIVAILSPIEYTSETTFVPQVSGDELSQTSNKLGSLASLAGINITPSEVTSDSYLSPLLYTKIVDSEEFSLELLDTELINLNSDKFTVREYLLSNESSFNFNLIGLIKKYSIGLFLNEKSNDANNDIFLSYNFISEEDFSILNVFKEKFTIKLNEDEGYIKVLAIDEDAFISSQLVEKVTKALQTKIIEIRTKKIKERLEFSKEQYELKQSEFDVLQQKLADFKDSNKNISTASFRSKLQKLESEYQLQQNILINLASEYNNNKIKLNKDTPIFSVIDEVSVPNLRSKPKRGLIVIIYTFIGLLLSVSFVLAKDSVVDLIKEIKD